MKVEHAAQWIPHRTHHAATLQKRLQMYTTAVELQLRQPQTHNVHFAGTAAAKQPKQLMLLLLNYVLPRLPSLEALSTFNVSRFYEKLLQRFVLRFPWYDDGLGPRATLAHDALTVVDMFIHHFCDQHGGFLPNNMVAVQPLNGLEVDCRKGHAEAQKRAEDFALCFSREWVAQLTVFFDETFEGLGTEPSCPIPCGRARGSFYITITENANPNRNGAVCVKIGQSKDTKDRVESANSGGHTFFANVHLLRVTATIPEYLLRQILRDMDAYPTRTYIDDDGVEQQYVAHQAYMKRKHAEMAVRGVPHADFLERAFQLHLADSNINHLDPLHATKRARAESSSASSASSASFASPPRSCVYKGFHFEKFLVHWDGFLDDLVAFLKPYHNVRLHGYVSSFQGPLREGSVVMNDTKRKFFDAALKEAHAAGRDAFSVPLFTLTDPSQEPPVSRLT